MTEPSPTVTILREDLELLLAGVLDPQDYYQDGRLCQGAAIAVRRSWLTIEPTTEPDANLRPDLALCPLCREPMGWETGTGHEACRVEAEANPPAKRRAA